MPEFDMLALRPLFEEILDVDELAKYESKPVTFSSVSTVGDRLVECQRCGAICDPDSGATEAHALWHENLSLTIWMLQGYIVHHEHLHEIEREE